MRERKDGKSLNRNEKAVQLDERGDYQMIDRAAGVAFSRLQQPVVPPWVNRQNRPMAKDEPETFNGLSAEDWQYIMDLERDARKLQGLALFLGGLPILFTVTACIMYQAGWIIH